MAGKSELQLFKNKRIRTSWDEQAEEWYFSVVDVVRVLSNSTDPTDYLKKCANEMRNLPAT